MTGQAYMRAAILVVAVGCGGRTIGGGSGAGSSGSNGPYTLTPTRTTLAPLPNGVGITYDGEELWMSTSDGKVVRFDPDALDIDRRYELQMAGGLQGITWDGASLWVAAGSDDANCTLNRLDASGNVARSTAAPCEVGPVDLDFDGTNLWFTDGVGGVYSLAPTSGEVLTTFMSAPQGQRNDGVAWRQGELWIGDLFGGMAVFGPSGTSLGAAALEGGGGALTQDQMGPTVFVKGQLVMLSQTGITYFDVSGGS